jgi:hypothetical protein
LKIKASLGKALNFSVKESKIKERVKEKNSFSSCFLAIGSAMVKLYRRCLCFVLLAEFHVALT